MQTVIHCFCSIKETLCCLNVLVDLWTRECYSGSKCCVNELYPTNEDVADISRGMEWIPHHLQTFLKIIVQSEVKRNSIGHSTIQSAQPRSAITPTLFGIGIEMDHVFGSRWLVNELSRIGFSITHDEVNRYKFVLKALIAC